MSVNCLKICRWIVSKTVCLWVVSSVNCLDSANLDVLGRNYSARKPLLEKCPITVLVTKWSVDWLPNRFHLWSFYNVFTMVESDTSSSAYTSIYFFFGLPGFLLTKPVIFLKSPFINGIPTIITKILFLDVNKTSAFPS